MPASYPNEKKVFVLRTDDVDDVMAEDINSAYLEIEAIEQHLLDNKGSINLASSLDIFGFTDRSKVNVYLSGVDKDTVNVDVVSGSYQYYYDGGLVTISTNKSIALPGSPHSNGMWFIYFTDNLGTLAVSQTPWNLLTHVPIAGVYWYQGNAIGSRALHADELHTCAWPKSLHRNHHLTEGSKTVGTVTFSGYTYALDTNTAVTFGISASTLADEDIFISLDALIDGNGTGANYSLTWHDSPTVFAFSQGNNFPYLNAPSGRVYYNNPSGGLVECGNGYYVNYYLWQTDFKGEARYMLMVGQSQHTLKTNAYSETVYSLNLTGFPAQEAVCIAQITLFTKDDKSNTGKCWLERIQPVGAAVVLAANGGAGLIDASLVALNISTFDKFLDATIENLQLLAQRIDEMVGAGISIESNKLVLNSTHTRAVSTNTSLVATDAFVAVNTSGGSVTITLEDASLVKDEITLKKVVAVNNMIINTKLGQTIDGQSSLTVKAQYTAIRLRSDGSNYHIV